GTLMAGARATVERWIKAHARQLRWLRPETGAFCCVQLDPDIFAPADAGHFHARLARQKTLVAQGTWFGDSPPVLPVGLAYEPADKFQEGLEAISAALEAGPNGITPLRH